MYNWSQNLLYWIFIKKLYITKKKIGYQFIISFHNDILIFKKKNLLIINYKMLKKLDS